MEKQKMFCPNCGTRCLKDAIPDMRQYICMVCSHRTKDDVRLIEEKDVQIL